jgi:hypothetical protein
MLSRALRRFVRYIWESLVIILAIDVLYAVTLGRGLSALDQTSPNVLAAAGVLTIVGGGSAAGTIRRGSPVILKDRIMLREKDRFDFAVVAVLLGLLYFGLAAAFFVSSHGPFILAVAIFAPLSIWVADSVQRFFTAKSARPPRTTG